MSRYTIDQPVNVIIIGEQGVGKRSLLTKLYSQLESIMASKRDTMNNSNFVILELGKNQSNYKSVADQINSSLGITILILIHDVLRKDTLLSIQKLLLQLSNSRYSKQTEIIVVGNKIDLLDNVYAIKFVKQLVQENIPNSKSKIINTKWILSSLALEIEFDEIAKIVYNYIRS